MSNYNGQERRLNGGISNVESTAEVAPGTPLYVPAAPVVGATPSAPIVAANTKSWKSDAVSLLAYMLPVFDAIFQYVESLNDFEGLSGKRMLHVAIVAFYGLAIGTIRRNVNTVIK